jgi:hypothetical protein
MGTFGTKNFQNDAAMDFEEEFLDNPTADTLKQALLTASGPPDHSAGEEYLEADEACAALAAAEIVAASLGKPATDFPDELQEITLALRTNTDLRKLARTAVGQVMTASELRELWADGDELAEWLAIQTDLLARLQ